MTSLSERVPAETVSEFYILISHLSVMSSYITPESFRTLKSTDFLWICHLQVLWSQLLFY